MIRRLGIVFKKEPTTTLDLTKGPMNPIWLSGALMNCVDSCFKASPDKPAIISGKEDTTDLEITTYGELEKLSNRVANGLQEYGFEPGDGIALYMPMTIECVAAYIGVVKAGCSVISIADSFAPPEVSRRLLIGDAKAIVTVESFKRGGKIIDLYEKVKEADSPRAIVIAAEKNSKINLRNRDLTWDDFLSSNDVFSSVSRDPYDVTNVLFSSGTTGTPKAIPWTHLTPIKCAMDGHFHQDIRPSDVVCWPTNIGWMMGPWLIYASLINDATMALYQGTPTGKGFARFVQQAKVTVLGLVPSLVRAWRSTHALDGVDWNHIRVFSSTGEPSHREDYLWLMSRAGYQAPIIEYCGGTEIGGGYITGTLVQPASPATFTTPALGIDIVILDEEGRPVAEGETGELYLIPPSIGLSQQLLNANHHAIYYASCPEGPKGEAPRRHGDLMTRLPNGFYKARGRADDTMNLGGIKVSSLEIEQVLDSHEAVYESAAVAVQLEGEGADRLIVYVVLSEEANLKQLKSDLSAMLAKQANPLFKIHDLVTSEQLPRTASNKLMRRQLRAFYVKRQSSSG
jgi:acetyl-CoA synthetase